MPGASRQQRGHSGLLEAFRIWPEQWDDYQIEILRIADLGDYVVVTSRTGGRGKQSGVESIWISPTFSPSGTRNR